MRSTLQHRSICDEDAYKREGKRERRERERRRERGGVPFGCLVRQSCGLAVTGRNPSSEPRSGRLLSSLVDHNMHNPRRPCRLEPRIFKDDAVLRTGFCYHRHNFRRICARRIPPQSYPIPYTEEYALLVEGRAEPTALSLWTAV